MNNNELMYEGQTLMKASEVAGYLNISRSLVYQLMKQGQLRTVKINNAKRVRFEDLMGFIDSSISQTGVTTCDS